MGPAPMPRVGAGGRKYGSVCGRATTSQAIDPSIHMNKSLLLGLVLLTPVALRAADSEAKDEITAAAHKLAGQSNYSWKTTVVVPESNQFKPGPTAGKTEKEGFTYVTMSFGDNLTEAVMKGEKAALTDQDGNWKLASEFDNAQGPGRFMARMIRNLKAPAAQATELLGDLKELKRDGDAYAGVFTDAGVRKQFRFGEPQNPKGGVKFWVKDGQLSKIEIKVEAKLEFNGNEIDAARTTTTEIKEIGTTKVNPPADAIKKLS